MADAAKQVYVVSDIHIGGEYPPSGSTGERGFRIATHIPRFAAFIETLVAKPAGNPDIELVINGDFVDFLAETDGAGEQWTPFTEDPVRATEKLETIVARDQPVFDALKALVQKGHRLTILLGNHDIELALPMVRARFSELMGISDNHKFSFIYDGEAYIIGDVLIEHGNRYDQFNVVNHDSLRRVRSLQSRHQETPAEHAFEAPPGSNIVASIMNPIKVDYSFIDLLKPETEAAIPMLLALEPGARKALGKFAGIALQAHKHRMADAAMPGFGGDIHASGEVEDFGGDIGAVGGWDDSPHDSPVEDDSDPLRKVLTNLAGKDADNFLQELDASTGQVDSIGEDISASDNLQTGWGLMRLALGGNNDDVERRLPALLSALRILRQDQSFDRSVETSSNYLDAAQELAKGGFKCVIFGHTHLPKDVSLNDGARYINTGTWADFMKFPMDIITGPKEQALAKLREFVEDLKAGRLENWVGFEPTYARVDLDTSQRLLHAELCNYEADSKV